jgi:hypothetical protein
MRMTPLARTGCNDLRMSVRSTDETTSGSSSESRLSKSVPVPGGPGYGWVLFAAVLLFLVGSANMIEGLAAIDGSNFFVRNAHDIFGNLSMWGWIIFAIGVAQYLAGIMVLIKNQLARWFGMATFAAGAMVELLSLPDAPFWSLAVVALNVLGLYALAVHGARIADPE